MNQSKKLEQYKDLICPKEDIAKKLEISEKASALTKTETANSAKELEKMGDKLEQSEYVKQEIWKKLSKNLDSLQEKDEQILAYAKEIYNIKLLNQSKTYIPVRVNHLLSKILREILLMQSWHFT